jgi:hypothetical protein
VRAPAHLADQTLLLNLAAKLPQGLLKLLLILDDNLQPLITPFCSSQRRRNPGAYGPARTVRGRAQA